MISVRDTNAIIYTGGKVLYGRGNSEMNRRVVSPVKYIYHDATWSGGKLRLSLTIHGIVVFEPIYNARREKL